MEDNGLKELNLNCFDFIDFFIHTQMVVRNKTIPNTKNIYNIKTSLCHNQEKLFVHLLCDNEHKTWSILKKAIDFMLLTVPQSIIFMSLIKTLNEKVL